MAPEPTSMDGSARAGEAGAREDVAGRGQEFTLAQLDALEDALEVISGPVVASQQALRASLDPALARRLEAYSELLELYARAQPMEEPPPGILDAVVEAAYTSARAPGEGASWRRWWDRLRRAALLPSAALVGTAAVVLLLVRPGAPALEAELPASPSRDAVTESSAKDAEEAEAEEIEAAADPVLEEELAAALDGDASADDGAGASAAVLQPPARAAAAPVKELSKDSRRPSAKKSKRAGGKRPLPGKKQASAPTPAPAPAYAGPRDKQTLRDELASADGLRRAGKCAAAERGYNALIGVGGLEQGRALAGLGLCAEARGELERAGHLFARARQAYGAIDGWIAAERERGQRMLGKD